MKKFFYTVTVILCAVSMTMCSLNFNVFADESTEISFSDYNFKLSTEFPTHWLYFTQADMNIEKLKTIKKTKDEMSTFMSKNDLIYYSANNNYSSELRLSVKETTLTDKIYNLDKTSFNKVTEYIDSLKSMDVIPSDAEIVNTNERYSHSQISFIIVEYTYSGYHCVLYTTVFNGHSLNIDCRTKSSVFDKTVVNEVKNFVSQIELKLIDKPNALEQDQLIVIVGGAALSLLFIILIAVGVKKKKRY